MPLRATYRFLAAAAFAGVFAHTLGAQPVSSATDPFTGLATGSTAVAAVARPQVHSAASLGLPDAPSSFAAAAKDEASAPGSFAARPDAAWETAPTLAVKQPRYNWTGLLLESFAFSAASDVFRLATDNVLRTLTVDKPYWHDYISSLQQFNMRRWNDGDDFLVNYVGHPMEGGIASYIQIQNSPHDSRLRWNDPGYWSSRTRALLWSAAYSTYSEIGPTGEAGLGSEGGYTYDVKCILHCNDTTAKPSGKETNNTGWVDFIITPSVGMLWVFAEDFLDKDVNERLIAHAPGRFYPRVIQSALNPTRSFANAMRGKVPWYRDNEYPIGSDNGWPHVHWQRDWNSTDAALESTGERKRFEIAPHWTSFATTVTTAHCQYCVQMTQGVGVQVSAQLWHWFYADTDVSYQPSASPQSSDRAGGSLVTGYFGVRGGVNTPHYALNLSVRPGFLQFHDAYLTSIPLSTPTVPAPANPPTPQSGTITHFAWNTMIAGDYKFTDHFALRAGIEETLVRYRNACLDSSGVGVPYDLNILLVRNGGCQVDAGRGSPPYITFLSHEDFVNRGSWGIQFGPVISF